MLFIAVVATIAGADNWIDVGDFADDKEEWLKKYISLEYLTDDLSNKEIYIDSEYTNWYIAINKITLNKNIINITTNYNNTFNSEKLVILNENEFEKILILDI
ncbi:transposase family protein [Abyssisolibacter fermentans]|uniref:transposase family protein n=1 Tax=Abyssisolibacter fermentans TaxID=1766203 RepID=UPI0009EA26E8